MGIRDTVKISRLRFGWLAVSLSIVVMAEALALFTGKMRIGSLFTPFGSTVAGIYASIGPVLPPMILLVALYLYITIRLIHVYRSGAPADPRLYTNLKATGSVATGLGFFGTTYGLVTVMSQIDPTVSQGAMLKALMNHSATAFGSTMLGLIISITAYITRHFFENVLLYEREVEDPGHSEEVEI